MYTVFEETRKEGEIVGRKEGRRVGRKEGKAYGIIEFALDLDYPNEQILSILQKKLGIDTKQAEAYLKSYQEGTLS